MFENDLLRISLIIFVIGFFSLFLIVKFVEPSFINSYQDIPSDNLVSFNAKVLSEYATQDGLVLEFQRPQKVLSYWDGSLNKSLIGKNVPLIGSLSDDWFKISSLTIIS